MPQVAQYAVWFESAAAIIGRSFQRCEAETPCQVCIGFSNRSTFLVIELPVEVQVELNRAA